MATPLRDHTALVTGASSGLGADFARQLAALGARPILVARRVERLEELAAELRDTHGADPVVLPGDLGSRAGCDALVDECAARELPVDVLVNNAGYGVFGEFQDIEWERELSMIELDVVSLVHLTKRFLPGMLERGRGYVLQVSSIGAFQPTPTYATYCASKAFVLSFGEALDYELAGTGVSCTTVCPGVTRTEFLDVSGQEATLYQRMVMMRSEDVVASALRAMLRRKPSVVPGWINALSAFSVRFVPRRLQAALASRLMR